MPITKEEIVEAINEGRVTCNIHGNAKISPQQAREFLLANFDRSFDPKYKVDLSFEDKYAHMLGIKENASIPQKIVSHQSSPSHIGKQNQRG